MKTILTSGISIRINENELALLNESKQRYLSTGRGQVSNREIFIYGIEKINELGLDTLKEKE